MKLVQIKCPSCGGQVDCSKDFTTAQCRFCQTTLALEWDKAADAPHIDEQCPKCGKRVEPDYVACPYCSEVILVDCYKCEKHIRKSWTTCPYCMERQLTDAEKLQRDLGIENKNKKDRKLSIVAGLVTFILGMLGLCCIGYYLSQITS